MNLLTIDFVFITVAQNHINIAFQVLLPLRPETVGRIECKLKFSST